MPRTDTFPLRHASITHHATLTLSASSEARAMGAAIAAPICRQDVPWRQFDPDVCRAARRQATPPPTSPMEDPDPVPEGSVGSEGSVLGMPRSRSYNPWTPRRSDAVIPPKARRPLDLLVRTPYRSRAFDTRLGTDRHPTGRFEEGLQNGHQRSSDRAQDAGLA